MKNCEFLMKFFSRFSVIIFHIESEYATKFLAKRTDTRRKHKKLHKTTYFEGVCGGGGWGPKMKF